MAKQFSSLESTRLKVEREYENTNEKRENENTYSMLSCIPIYRTEDPISGSRGRAMSNTLLTPD